MFENSTFTIYTHTIKDNVDRIYNSLSENTEIIPVLKGNAYGHGLVEVGKIMQHDSRITCIAVAQVSEGIALREAGISKRIMILGGLTQEQFSHLNEYDLEPTIYDLHSLLLLIKVHNDFPIHIKLNTGLNRLGFKENELDALIDVLKQNSSIKIMSTYSHFIEGLSPNSDLSNTQYLTFNRMVNTLKDNSINPGTLHLCDSGAYEWNTKAHFDAVRIGRALYMDNPLKPEEQRYKDAGTWSASLVGIHKLGKGDTFSYSKIEVIDDMVIGIVNIGYADGLLQGISNLPIIVNHQKTKVLSVAMDQCFVDLTNIDASINDEVILFGESSKGTYLSSNEVASIIDDEGCTLTSKITDRVKRVYK